MRNNIWLLDVNEAQYERRVGPKSSQEEALEDYAILSCACFLGCLVLVGIAAMIYSSL